MTVAPASIASRGISESWFDALSAPGIEMLAVVRCDSSGVDSLAGDVEGRATILEYGSP
jgi:hypothetical protein